MLNKALDHGVYWNKGGVQALKGMLCELRRHVSGLRAHIPPSMGPYSGESPWLMALPYTIQQSTSCDLKISKKLQAENFIITPYNLRLK
jgi:hypothetical protein